MEQSKEQSKILKTILEKIGNERLIAELTTSLSQSEISTLLLALSKEITAQSTPSELLSKYASNRFVKPSALDPIKLKRAELSMLEMADQAGFRPVMLSPASPLGSCSVIAKVDQNNVISASRGIELISDSTNMLAIHLANGIRNKTIDNTKTDVHVSAACRVTRGQLFKGDHTVPHFGLFALVSSGKDTGSYRFEKGTLAKHIEFYTSYFGEKLGHEVQVYLNLRKGYTDTDGLIDRIYDHLTGSFPSAMLTANREESDNRYYQGINFTISVNGISVVDGGFTDWTQQLLGNKKERLLISGTGIDMQLITGMLG